MANQVIKRDGTKESFDSEKIKKSIEMAAKEAGLLTDRISEIVNQVSSAVLELAASKEEIATTELAEKITSELDKIEPAAAAAWRKYEQEKAASE